MASRRPSSPPSTSGASSRDSSVRSPSILQHAPVTPSGLREAHTISSSPEDLRHTDSAGGESRQTSAEPSPRTRPTHIDFEPAADGATETTSLLKRPFELAAEHPHSGPCDHGTFSPRLESRAGSFRNEYGFGGSPPQGQEDGGSKSTFGSFLENVGMRNGGKKKMSTTNWLAERHGITNKKFMYVLYPQAWGAWPFL